MRWALWRKPMNVRNFFPSQRLGLKQTEGDVPVSELSREHGMSMQNDLLTEALEKLR